MRRITLSFLLCAVFTMHLWGQNVSSALQGTVVDTTNAIVVGADVQLLNQDIGMKRSSATNAKGLFRFSEIPPGTYTINVKMKGFKGFTLNQIVLVGSETRDLGLTRLEVGSATESVVVNAEVTPVETASSEKASTIDPNEMENQAVRGRDMVAYMDLIPGLVDNPQSGAGAPLGREVTSTQALSGITINGADLGHINYTVDGIPAIDSSTQYLHYEPNVDSIQELKVMTSNYQAEFGRNSGGTITVITKGGSKDFHGSSWWEHRHEQFDANDYFNDQTDTAKPLYRFNVAGWSVGGPVYVPGKFNTQKNKLFFFATQEYTRQLVPASSGLTYETMPTDAEIAGDFTDVTDVDGTPVPISYYDTKSSTKMVIPGCEANRTLGSGTCNLLPYQNSVNGAAMLKWINSTSGGSAAQGSYTTNGTPANWVTAGTSGQHPRRNDMIRIDANPTSKLSAYFRWIQDTDNQVKHDMQSTWDVWPVKSPNPGHGYVGSATWVINPTTVNEVTVGKDFTAWSWTAIDPSSASVATAGNLPTYYPIDYNTAVNGLQSVTPNIYFTSSLGGGPGGGGGGGGCNTTPCNPPDFNAFLWDYYNTQNYWTVTDNLSKVIQSHNLKAGLYLEKQNKIQPGVQQYNGEYAFGAYSNTPGTPSYSQYPLDAGDGYANAFLGNFSVFKQASGRTVADVNFWNIEWYAQDNWRVTKRLTLDVGVRFYHPTPYVDNANTISFFDPSSWVHANAPILNANTDQITCSGSASSGCNITNGMVVNGHPYSTKWLEVAPRLGFALDLFGDGKTAIRGGFGMFPNRESGQLFNGGSGMVMSGQIPVLNYATLNSGGTMGSISTLANPISPSAVTSWTGRTQYSDALNASFGVQQSIGHNMVLDVSYVGAWAQHQPLSVNINTDPLYSCSFAQVSCPAGQEDSLRQYTGYEAIDMEEFIGSNNYHSLQSTLQRRFSNGLMIGAALTYSKQLTQGFDPLLNTTQNRIYDYTGGPAGSNLEINYAYTLPKLAPHLNNQPGAKLVGVVTDNWSVSGITHLASGSAYTVSCSVEHGNLYGLGTPDESQRCNQISDPKSGRGKLQFNPAAYAIAPAYSLGNAQQNNLVGPGIDNWDVTLSKNIPLGGERRKLKLEAQTFNVFNHPQFKGVSSSLSFMNGNSDGTGWVLDTHNISSTGLPGSGTGAYSSSSGGGPGGGSGGTQQARIIGFTARIEF